jgi:hypothetical protein
MNANLLLPRRKIRKTNRIRWLSWLQIQGCGIAGPQGSDSVKRHLPIEYAADLTPVVAGKEAGASWNARGMENALDF